MKLALYGSRQQAPFAPQIAAFLDTLAQQGVEVVMHKKLYDTLCHLMPLHLAAVRKVVATPDFDADFAISIGGDGTFLRTAMWVGDKNIPVIGVNTGHLGYLSGATIEELPLLLDELKNHRFKIEYRSLIEVVAPQISQWPFALNEVAITKEDTASMIVADTSIDGAPLASYRADGIIISTPTGSTAYNLSVGGPVVQPTAPVWVISPIAAHSLGMRPLVISDSAELSAVVHGRGRNCRLAIDGRAITLPIDSCIKLRKAPFQFMIVMRDGHEFPAPLREKLRWSE